MTLYDRYINGQEKQVYDEIDTLKQEAFSSTNLPIVEKVLTETFQRVAYNLDIIYTELKNLNYLFPTKFEYNFERPLNKPLPDTEALLKTLDTAVRSFGFVPLSLKTFYRIVGSCNFCWDYKTNEDYLWQFADPIQVISLDDLVSEITGKDFSIDLKDCYEEDGFVSLQLSADYLHKDNTSGGPAYALKITGEQSVDGEFLNEEHQTTLINYLRICFENCGFSRITDPETENDYQAFFDKVKPQLKRI